MFKNFYRNKRVLLTGHTGFKGSWLCEWLLEMGAEVCGIALAPNTENSIFETLGLEGRIEHHLCDIRDVQKVSQIMSSFEPEIVLHLAAQPLVRLSYNDPITTLNTNIMGTAHVLDAIRHCPSVRSCVVITSDKCYENREWSWGYRETDSVGGHDPYSASKGAAELVAACYRNSFFHKRGACKIATARAGNVIGGGDWSPDRIVVDFIKSMAKKEPLRLRSPYSVRPWQHVLEPLSGYLTLAKKMYETDEEVFQDAWNFGPGDEAIITVEKLTEKFLKVWGEGTVEYAADVHQPHEATLLKLDCSKAHMELGWKGIWSINKTVEKTVEWYKAFYENNQDMRALTIRQISDYMNTDKKD